MNFASCPQKGKKKKQLENPHVKKKWFVTASLLFFISFVTT
jgi:hypothetical protein